MILGAAILGAAKAKLDNIKKEKYNQNDSSTTTVNTNIGVGALILIIIVGLIWGILSFYAIYKTCELQKGLTRVFGIILAFWLGPFALLLFPFMAKNGS